MSASENIRAGTAEAIARRVARRAKTVGVGAAIRGRERLRHEALRWSERVSDRTVVELDHPTSSLTEPRYGWGKEPHAGLQTVIERFSDRYLETIGLLERFGDDLAKIARDQVDETEPFWNNTTFSGLDGATLYCLLRKHSPRHYFEIGSGNSTKFARRAIRDGGLATEIVSIDPRPIYEIDGLCDRAIREPLERYAPRLASQIEPGDIVFLDGSHRVFMNSDVTAFFLDVLPNLDASVLVGIHDIFLPDDYPADWVDQYLSEQYLLGAALLYGNTLRPLLACHYAGTREPLRGTVWRQWQDIGFAGLNAYGSSFWLQPGHHAAQRNGAGS